MSKIEKHADTEAHAENQGKEVTDAALAQISGGHVTPDLALSDVKAEDYSASTRVGGYGSASYQFANETYR